MVLLHAAGCLFSTRHTLRTFGFVCPHASSFVWCVFLQPRWLPSLSFTVVAAGSDMEVDEASQIIGIFGLYALFRMLVPRHIEPDYDLFARLWKVQERIPVVPIFGRVVWAPDEFLLRFAAIKTMNVKKLQPKVRRCRTGVRNGKCVRVCVTEREGLREWERGTERHRYSETQIRRVPWLFSCDHDVGPDRWAVGAVMV